MLETINLEQISGRSLVSLKVALQSADEVRKALHLAPPLHVSGSSPGSCWVGPDHWLLIDEDLTSEEMINHCGRSLGHTAHLAVDRSDALDVLSLEGSCVRSLLAQGTGIDLRLSEFSAGRCARTRLAGVATLIVAAGDYEFELYFDRSYRSYMKHWLRHAAETAETLGN